MSNLKRYQNPEVFEQLAIEYVVGGLSGRARKRFEVLMENHFYLRALVGAYESQFANLVELVPEEQPSDTTWDAINNAITPEKPKAKQSWLQRNIFSKQGLGFAMAASLVAIVLIVNPISKTPSDELITQFSAVMESDKKIPVAVTKIEKSDMKLTIDVMKKIDIASNEVLMLWCHPKNGGKPTMMGKIAKNGKTEISISKEEWGNMMSAGKLAVSVEHIDNTNKVKKPSNRIMLEGKLSSLTI